MFRKLMGAATPLPPVLPLPLGAAMPAVGNRTEFIRGKIEDGRALPFRNQDRAALALLAEAAILVRRDAGAQAVPAGTLVHRTAQRREGPMCLSTCLPRGQPDLK